MWTADFLRCIEESTLGNPRIGEALAIKEAHLPKRIYKYRCYGPTSLSNLKGDTVWLGSPEAFNDPYDCAFRVSGDIVFRAFEKRLVEGFVRTYGLDAAAFSDQIEDAKRSPEPLKYIAKHISEFTAGVKGSDPVRMADFNSLVSPRLVNDAISILRLWKKVTKLCCFSAINDSVLMWSHYADQHKGFCLEYDLEALNADHIFRTNLYPVIYSPQLYDLTRHAEGMVGEDRQLFNDVSPLLGVLHRFEGWIYEQEWRLVSISPAVLPDEALPAPTPSRIFLGSRLDTSKAGELLAICEQKEVPIYRMRMADERFQLLSEPFVR